MTTLTFMDRGLSPFVLRRLTQASNNGFYLTLVYMAKGSHTRTAYTLSWPPIHQSGAKVNCQLGGPGDLRTNNYLHPCSLLN